MSELIKYQVIKDGDRPLFVLVPYEEYLKLTQKKEEEEVTIPHEVVERHVLENKSLIRAWREYKDLTQREVAAKMGVTQAAYSQMEKTGAHLRKTSLEKIAQVLEIRIEQLTL